MKKPQKTTILLTLFTVLTIISLTTIYITHQTPTEETTTNTLCKYTSTATYDYIATLEPNTIYNNQTTLTPDEGTLYTKITKQINITLTYTFHTTIPSDATITYSLTQTLKTTAWSYTLNQTTQTTTNQKIIQITLQPVNPTALTTLKTQIEQETGTSTTTYTLEITPTFTINANTTAGTIQQTFTPTLTINFQRTSEGDTITIQDLHQTKTEALTENQTTTRQDILLQRNTSYILIAISAAGLAFSTYFYTKTKPKTEEIPLEKLLQPYKDLIIEATEPPKTPPETTTINIKDIKELAKTAEILAKPIILTKKPKPTLTIIDQNITYQHTP